MSTLATQTREQAPGETLNHAVDCSGRLAAAELLTGTPTVTISPAVSGQPTNPQVNGSTVVIMGNSCIAGKAVLFTVTGLTLDTEYTITISCGSTSSPAETIVGTLKLECRT